MPSSVLSPDHEPNCIPHLRGYDSPGGSVVLTVVNQMTGVSLPVNRPVGRALVVGSAGSRAQPMEVLQRLYGFECVPADDPYAAMLELCGGKTVYNALILSLASLYREELQVLASVKRRFPHLEVWLTHTDGRQAALAESMRLGADGLLGEDGLHRIAPLSAVREVSAQPSLLDEPSSRGAETAGAPDSRSIDEITIAEPVLTTDELRALLQDQASMPPSGNPPEA